MPIIDGLKEGGGGCALFSVENRGRKGKGRIPHKV
jgi:hypothetical protein